MQHTEKHRIHLIGLLAEILKLRVLTLIEVLRMPRRFYTAPTSRLSKYSPNSIKCHGTAGDM